MKLASNTIKVIGIFDRLIPQQEVHSDNSDNEVK